MQMSYLDSVAVALDQLDDTDLAALQDIRVCKDQLQYMIIRRAWCFSRKTIRGAG